MEIIVKGSSLTQFGIEGTNYCGPGYADGKLLGDNEKATYREPATGPVDEACKAHDQAYDALKDSPNPAYDRMQADLKLIDDVAAALASGELSAYDAAVAAAVIGAFMGKTALYDVPAVVLEAARGLLQRLLDALGTGGNPFTADFGYTPESLISPEVWNDFTRAKTWTWLRDPILLDLDGDGLETVGLASNVYFDHDGDGVLTKTGWAGKDDALLVWDRNANGLIDTGAELFGDFSVLPNGTLAPNGFAALAALDANGDGVIDASDPAFAELKLWRDTSQDGQTGAGELISLQDAGIVSLNLAHTLKNQRLANGNTLSREGSFTRADGSTGGMGEFRLAIDTFHTKFAETIEVPEALKGLPNMMGAGNVRELREAAAQSATLAALLAQFQNAPTRAEQKALLDQLLTSWADTSGMAKSLEERAAGKYRIVYEAFGNERRSSHIDTVAFAAISSGSVGGGGAALMTDFGGLYLSERYRNLIAEWSRKLHVLEAFNGQYFFNLPEKKSQTDGANWGLSISAGSGGGSGGAAMAIEAYPTLRVNFSQAQLDLLQQAYDSLKESVYASLVLQTRLKPYLDQIELVIDDSGLRLDATRLNQTLAAKKAADPENYLADLLDLDRYAGNFLSGTNWQGLADFDTLIDTLPNTPAIQALLDEFKLRRLTTGDDNAYLTDQADIVLAGDGKDSLLGNKGNDRLFGQGGEDRIYGGAGDDLISGGAGNDLLYGESGADTYVFGRGYGNDTIVDYAESGVQRDTVRLLGLTPADIRVTADYADNLVFTIVDTGETLTVPRNGYWWGSNGVGQYVFDDGTVWSHDDALRATVAAATENDDVIHGSSAGDAIAGGAGNDTLIGHGGNDVIDGGAGNDLLIGSTGWNWIWENGQWRQARSLAPSISANGNDTYLFGRGDGQDTVIDGDYTAGNSDTLRFKEGVTLADVRFIRDGQDLVLAIRGTDDKVTLKRYFDEAWNGANGPWLIERIAFHDGTVLNFADVQAALFAGSEEAETIIGSRVGDVLTGQGGNDILIGNGGDDRLEGGDGDDLLLGGAGRDILDGGAGNDVLRGGGAMGWGNQVYDGNGEGDTYRFGRGDGHDTIIDDSWIAGEIDRIELKAGVSPDDVRLERVRTVNGWQVSDDLKITLRDTGETLTVRNHFDESDRHAVEEIVFADGTVWDAETIKSRSLLGEAGNDELHGFNRRDDVLVGGAGNDVLDGKSGNDTLLGGSGQDTLFGRQGDDILQGGEGDDILYGNEGSDTLAGNAGNDQLYGGDGNDLLNGGEGNDVLEGGLGDDTYRFGRGYGNDVAIEAASAVTQGNWIVFDADVSAGDMVVRKSGSDLILRIVGTNDAMTLKNAAAYLEGSAFAGVRFADGTTWDYESLKDRVLLGTEDADRIEGFDGRPETVDGGAGNDVIIGGTGADIYLFGRGDGQDVIIDRDTNAANVDVLRFKAGVLPSEVTLNRDNLDLVVRIPDSGDSVTIRKFYEWGAGGWHHRIERLEFADGTAWTQQDILSRATLSPQAGSLVGTPDADYLVGNGADNVIEGHNGDDVLIGNAGDDILVGGLGSDWLYGGEGNDVLYGLLRATDSANEGSVLTPTVHYYLNEAGNALINDLSASWPGFGENSLPRNDDGYLGPIDITPVFGAEGVNFFGQRYTALYVNNNGNITFGNGLTAYTPHLIGAGSRAIIAPFWADVDTRAGPATATPGGNSQGTNLVYYDLDTSNGVFTATWDDVGYYSFHTDKLNAFQVQLVNRGMGDFDIVFRYEAINWTTGDASGGVNGLGGTPARAGYSAGTSNPEHYYELPASANQTAMLALDTVPGNTGRNGVYVFHVRNGMPIGDNRNLIRNGDTGINRLYGGPGDDVYVIDTLGDVVVELQGEGIDHVLTSVGYTLPEHVEHLTLTDTRDIDGTGNALDNLIVGNAGSNTLRGAAGDDRLDGAAGDDVIYGGPGVDTLRGGPGRDHLYGEEGGDIYLYEPGDDEVIIEDDHGGVVWSGGAPNVLVFGTGIHLEDLRLSGHQGDLLIEFANRPSDRVILRGYEPGRATQTRSVDIIRFADGREIVALIAGNDSGDDELSTQAGASVLTGGTGSDTYRVHLAAGTPAMETLIVETWRAQDTNRIELTGDIDAGALRLEFDGHDLLLRLTDAGDAIRFAGFDPRAEGMQAPVSQIRLPWQGVTLSFDELLARGVRIIGTPNDDVLTGTALSDWIEGRESDDTLSGGAGGDLYIIDADAGSDTIIDTENGDAPNTLVLPEGTTLDDVRLSFDAEGFLILDLANTGNRVRLSGFDPQNPLGPRAVERFRFGPNGDEIGYEELLSRGFDIVGTGEGDALKGTALSDRVWGGDGNDLIEASPGGDVLSGEGGNDTYVVNLGDGIVTIGDVAREDAGNVLRFGPGIDPNVLRNNLRFEADGNGGHVLLIPYGDAGDVVRLTGFDPVDALGSHAVERFEFADGTVVDYATLVSWTFVVEGDNAGNALTGTNVGDRLYGYDGDDVMASGDGEDVLTGGLGNDVLRGGAHRDAYVVNLGDGEDIIEDDLDAGIGNVLTFGAGIAREDVRLEVDGDDLLIHYGAGGDVVRVANYAPDGASGGTVIDTFEFADGTAITLREFMNRAPEVANPVDDQVALEDAAFRLVLPDDLFIDADGDAILTRVAVSGYERLPQWLQYDATTRTLYGTPENGDVGEFDVIVQGMDALGASALHSFHVTVQNTNDAPEVVQSIADQQATEDAPFRFTVPEDAFRDVDLGDALTFSATRADGSALPAWLIFDAATRTFSGVPVNGDVGSVSLKLTATDLAGAQASQTFAIAVANTNDAPEVGVPLANQNGRVGEPVSWRLPAGAFFDVDAGDVLTYSATLADGSVLPGWLSFDAATGTFSGTPTAAGSVQLRVTATDLAGASASQSLTLTITGGNLPPLTAPDAASVSEDCKLITWGNVLANDRDPEGSALTVTDAGIRRGEYGWLKLLPDGRYAYVLDNASSKVQSLAEGERVTDRFAYTASDGTAASSGELIVTVSGNNDAPVLARKLSDVQLAKGRAFSWQIPAGSFTDIDRADTLTYTATLANGKPLPSWLKFDAATQTFSGTAPAGSTSSIDVKVVASDGHGVCSTASDVFRISIGNKTVLPTASKGNEGLGNGCDAPPPGHAANWNDGPGTAPGNPGSKAQKDDLLDRFLDGFKADAKAAANKSSLGSLDAGWFDRWLTPPAPSNGQATSSSNGQAVEAHWQHLLQALNRLDAERQGAATWLGKGQGADLSGLWGLASSSNAWLRTHGDAVGLAAGAQLKGFAGLSEGMSKLTC